MAQVFFALIFELRIGATEIVLPSCVVVFVAQ